MTDAIKELLNVDLLCQPNFDESALFSDPEKEQLRIQLKQHFRNISLIMVNFSRQKFPPKIPSKKHIIFRNFSIL